MKKLILTAAAAAAAIAGMAAPALADPYHGDRNRFEQRTDQRSFRGLETGRWQHRNWRGGNRFGRYAHHYRGHSKRCVHRADHGRRG